jgi:hypothetical protein
MLTPVMQLLSFICTRNVPSADDFGLGGALHQQDCQASHVHGCNFVLNAAEQTGGGAFFAARCSTIR